MKLNKNTVLLVGGGTGGHIVPVLNIYKELKRECPEVLVKIVGGNTPVDQKFYSGLDDFSVLYTGKMHRALTLNNILQLFYLVFGIFQSLAILLRTRPAIIFSKAGYISFPIILWAKILRIPYIIHESDIELGRSNQFAANKATKIFTGFPKNNYPDKFRSKMDFSGQILRPDIFSSDGNLYDFGLDNKKPTIFITGGSQGARNINKAIFNALPKMLTDFNLIHHVGKLDYGRAIELRSSLDQEHKKSYYISELLTDTRDGRNLFVSAILLSELVVSRSSATTMGEIAALAKPIITIPYRYAASDHQTKNAIFYDKAGAAEVIIDDKKLGENLTAKIYKLLDDKKAMNKMASSAEELFPKDGLEKVTTEILKHIKNKCEEV